MCIYVARAEVSQSEQQQLCSGSILLCLWRLTGQGYLHVEQQVAQKVLSFCQRQPAIAVICILNSTAAGLSAESAWYGKILRALLCYEPSALLAGWKEFNYLSVQPPGCLRNRQLHIACTESCRYMTHTS